MTTINLKHRKVIPSALEQFGFLDTGEDQVYFAMLAAGAFRMELHVDSNGIVRSAVYDRETNEEYARKDVSRHLRKHLFHKSARGLFKPRAQSIHSEHEKR